MPDKNTVKLIEEKISGVSGYVQGLQWFPGNAALKWIAESCTKTAGIINDTKKAKKNIKEIMEYIEGLHWFKGNAALEFAHTELKESLAILSDGKDESDYDEPNPQPSKSEPEAEPKITEKMEADLISGAVEEEE